MPDNNQPAAAPALPLVAVMPAANTPPPVIAHRILLTVCLWALVNAGVFAAVAFISNRTPCTKVLTFIIVDHHSSRINKFVYIAI
jgi:uncharacterized RDD family membrane protein YckC